MKAAFWGHADIVEYLLTEGCNVNAVDDVWLLYTPLALISLSSPHPCDATTGWQDGFDAGGRELSCGNRAMSGDSWGRHIHCQ